MNTILDAVTIPLILKSAPGLKVLISGSGNVAQFAAEKVMELGGHVCSFSDSTGTISSEEGYTNGIDFN